MEQIPAPFYLIRLNPPPRKIFARQNTRQNFRWAYHDRKPDRLEILCIVKGSISELRQGHEITWPQGSVQPLFYNCCREHYSHDPVTTQCFLELRLSSPPTPMSAEEVCCWKNTTHLAIVPERVTDREVCARIHDLVLSARRLVRLPKEHPSATARSMRLRAIMYECLAMLTEQAVLQARAQMSQAMNPYTQKARDYIHSHLRELPSMEELAKQLGISYGHLNRVFREDMNVSLLEYVIQTRIRIVEQAITTEGLTMREAGEKVGISDEKYLSRLFHRYTGLTAAEWRREIKKRQEP